MGLPTKVARDTYYPDVNYSEEVNVHVSPNIKTKKRRRDRGRTEKAKERHRTSTDRLRYEPGYYCDRII